MAVATNIFALAAVSVMLADSIFGLDTIVVDSFVSLRNDFLLLVLGLGSLVLLEPLRAAMSAVVYVDGRVRRDGLDLRAAVDQATRIATPDGRRVMAAALCALCTLSGPVAAQAPGEPPTAPLLSTGFADERVPPVFELSPGDVQVTDRANTILERPEFREFAEHGRPEGLRDLLTRLGDWLDSLFEEEDEDAIAMNEDPSLPLPPPMAFYVLGASLLIGVAAYLFATRRKDAGAIDPRKDVASALSPLDRSPGSHLEEASELAARGRYRDALRSLYLATLVALDRRRLIVFDPTLTNWQYIRQMPVGEERTLFHEFTRLFDHKWYGEEPTSEGDFATCRGLASRIVTEGPKG
jgi:hypothetical protein